MSSPYKLPKANFTHYEIALIAFLSNLEKKIHIFNNKVPVLFNAIDESFYLLQKYKSIPREKVQELYNVVPRCVVKFIEIGMLPEDFTSNYLKQTIKLDNDKEFILDFRYGPTNITLDLNFVTSNFIMGLRYLEILNTIFCVDNVYTYNYDGNNYDAAYSLQGTLTMESPDMSFSEETKNSIIKGQIILNLKPSFYNLQSVQNIYSHNNNNGDDLIDTDILIDNETGESINLWIDGNDFANSKYNSVQPLNDLSLTDKEKEKILTNSHTKKIANQLIKLKPEDEQEHIIKSKGLSDE